MSEIRLLGLTRSFGETASAGLFDFSLEIPTGQICTVVGPSGAGKTTLLRLIAGLEAPDAGAVVLGERNVTMLLPQDRNVGLLAQRPVLYPHLNVRRNLSIGLEMWHSRHAKERVGPVEMSRRVDQAIQFLDLASVLNRRPEQLSGGEVQRVALGRILVRRPPVWLLDEPLSHLDSARKMEFRRHLHLLRGAFPATMIIVTHDPVEALTLGQRLAVLEAGRLRQFGVPPEVYSRPADRFVAGFLGWPPSNLADGVLVRGFEPGEGLRFAAADGSFHLPVPAELVTHGAEGQPVAVGIRPEELEPAPPTHPLQTDGVLTLPGWRVARAEFVPPRWLLVAERGRWSWQLWHRGPAPGIGDVMDLAFEVQKLNWFDGRTGKRIEKR